MQTAKFARQLKVSYVPKAIYQAARMADEAEATGEAGAAVIWRKLEAAIREAQAPHES